MYKDEESAKGSVKKFFNSRSGRVFIAIVVIALIIGSLAIGNRLGQAHGGRYADHQIWEIGGELTMAKLFCLPPQGGTEATDCKWLLTIKVDEVDELQAGKGILEDPVAGKKYVIDLRDSKVNNYVTGKPINEVRTGSAVTYEFEIIEKEARMIVAETADTSSSLPEIIGAVR